MHQLEPTRFKQYNKLSLSVNLCTGWLQCALSWLVYCWVPAQRLCNHALAKPKDVSSDWPQGYTATATTTTLNARTPTKSLLISSISKLFVWCYARQLAITVSATMTHTMRCRSETPHVHTCLVHRSNGLPAGTFACNSNFVTDSSSLLAAS